MAITSAVMLLKDQKMDVADDIWPNFIKMT